jgi:hypothetical protein
MMRTTLMTLVKVASTLSSKLEPVKFMRCNNKDYDACNVRDVRLEKSCEENQLDNETIVNHHDFI